MLPYRVSKLNGPGGRRRRREFRGDLCRAGRASLSCVTTVDAYYYLMGAVCIGSPVLAYGV